MEYDQKTIRKILKLMDERPSSEETKQSRRQRYISRQERNGELRKEERTDQKEKENNVDQPLEISRKRRKKVTIDDSDIEFFEIFEPETFTEKQSSLPVNEEENVEEQREKKMKVLVKNLTSKSLNYTPENPPEGYLQGKLPSWYFERRDQQEKDKKLQMEKKALRLKNEREEKLEKIRKQKEKEQVEREAKVCSNEKKRKTRNARLSKLTDPSVPPSEISLFQVESLPLASIRPKLPPAKNIDPVVGNVEEELIYDDSLNVPLDDLFLPDVEVDVDDVILFEQKMLRDAGMYGEPGFFQEFEIEPDQVDPNMIYEPCILDEEDNVLYAPDESMEELGDGIDDSFLEIINDDDVKVDPVEVYNEMYTNFDS